MTTSALLSFEGLQSLQGPAEAIAGLQDIIVEELSQAPAEARTDAGQVQIAAQNLLTQVTALGDVDGESADRAKLRHDLRTPINAIVGYTELLLEESEALPAVVISDMEDILRHAGDLQCAIDAVMGKDVAFDPRLAQDSMMISDLKRSLAAGAMASTGLTGEILVIDDTAANRDLLKRQLQRRGHRVVTASSGKAGLEALAGQPFDLIFVDVLMPDLNGIDLLARIKAERAWADIPVLVISGLKDIRAVTRCIEAGAEDYLQKPVDPVLLHCRVDTCLERREWRKQEAAYKREIEFQRDRADQLLAAMLPRPVINRLQAGETVIADRFDSVTIVFADIVNFTETTARADPGEIVQRLSDIFQAFDELAIKHGVEKIKTIGDAYMVASGVPEPCDDHALRAAAFARDLFAVMPDDMPLRVGMHAGPVVAGLIGQMRFVFDVWGETVNVASRLEAAGTAGFVHLSKNAHALLGAPTPAKRAVHHLKGLGETETVLLSPH